MEKVSENKKVRPPLNQSASVNRKNKFILSFCSTSSFVPANMILWMSLHMLTSLLSSLFSFSLLFFNCFSVHLFSFPFPGHLLPVHACKRAHAYFIVQVSTFCTTFQSSYAVDRIFMHIIYLYDYLDSTNDKLNIFFVERN